LPGSGKLLLKGDGDQTGDLAGQLRNQDPLACTTQTLGCFGYCHRVAELAKWLSHCRAVCRCRVRDDRQHRLASKNGSGYGFDNQLQWSAASLYGSSILALQLGAWSPSPAPRREFKTQQCQRRGLPMHLFNLTVIHGRASSRAKAFAASSLLRNPRDGETPPRIFTDWRQSVVG
jgi:hypothetical protein